MKKTLWSRLAVLCMAAAMLLSACSGAAPAGEDSAADPASTAAPAAEGDAAAPASDSGDPFAEPWSFSVSLHRPFNQADSLVEQMFEEKYNVDINMIIMPAPPDFQSKLNLMMADPSQRPDVVWWDWNWEKEYTQWRDAGLLVDVADYYFKYPNIREYCEGVWGGDAIFHASELDGRLFRIPGDISEPGHMTTLIRTDWLENAGLQMPTTHEEFIAALRAFKDNKPAYNDNPEAYPFLAQSGGAASELRSFMPWWSYYEVVCDQFQYLEDGKTVGYGPMQPQMKEALTELSTLFQEGIIDPNCLTPNWQQTETQAAGNWGSTYRWVAGFNTQGQAYLNFKASTPEGDFARMAPLPNPNGTETERGISYRANYYFGVTDNGADRAEQIYAFFDGMAAGDDYLLKKFGRAGTDYTYEDGVYTQILSDDDNISQNIGRNIFMDFFNRKDEMNIANLPEVAQMFADCTEAAQIDINRSVYLKNTDRPVWNQYRVELERIRDEYILGMLSGSRPMSDFEVMVDLWNSSGGTEATAETQQFADAQAGEFEAWKAAFVPKA